MATTDCIPGVPPHNIDAERALLGAILLDPGVLDDVRHLVRPEDFYNTGHRTIYRVACTVHDEGQRADPIVVQDRLETLGSLEPIGGERYLAELAGMVPSAAGAEDYARIVSEKASLRDVDAAYRRWAQDPGREPAALLADLEAVQRQPRATSDLVVPFEGCEDLLDALERRRGGIDLNVPGLYDHLNPLCGDLVLLSAFASTGKSTLLSQLADDLNRRGVHVLCFLAEQSWRAWACMTVARSEHINSKWIESGRYPDDRAEELRAAVRVCAEEWRPTLERYRRYAAHFPGSTTELVGIVERYHATLPDEERLVVLVDALHNIPTTNGERLESVRVEMDATANLLRDRICSTLGVPVIAACQLSREGRLKESGGLDHLADVHLSLVRDLDEDKHRADQERRRDQYGHDCTMAGGYHYTPLYLPLRVVKQRDGEQFETTLRYRPPARLFEDAALAEGFDL